MKSRIAEHHTMGGDRSQHGRVRYCRITRDPERIRTYVGPCDGLESWPGAEDLGEPDPAEQTRELPRSSMFDIQEGGPDMRSLEIVLTKPRHLNRRCGGEPDFVGDSNPVHRYPEERAPSEFGRGSDQDHCMALEDGAKAKFSFRGDADSCLDIPI